MDMDIFTCDDRPALLRRGWAPGNYSNECRHCGTIFTGDKLAGSCADCAYSLEETKDIQVYPPLVDGVASP